MTSPNLDAAHVVTFCSEISPEIPVLVPIRPFPGAEPLNCHNNVDLVKHAGNPGKPIYGWHLTEWPGVFIEAERHTIWEDDRGYSDPSPHLTFREFIAFLPDPKLGEFDFPELINKPLVKDRYLEEMFDSSRSIRQSRKSGRLPHPAVFERMQASLRRLSSRYGPEPFEVPPPYQRM